MEITTQDMMLLAGLKRLEVSEMTSANIKLQLQTTVLSLVRRVLVQTPLVQDRLDLENSTVAYDPPLNSSDDDETAFHPDNLRDSLAAMIVSAKNYQEEVKRKDPDVETQMETFAENVANDLLQALSGNNKIIATYMASQVVHKIAEKTYARLKQQKDVDR